MIIYKKFVRRIDLSSNRNTQYLFGDNDQRKGMGGQAGAMRFEPNAIGIRTKKAPSMEYPYAFYFDTEFDENKKKIDEDFSKIDTTKDIVIPEGGLGTGRAMLKRYSPRTFQYILSKIDELKRKV